MIVRNMKNKLLEKLANEISKSENRYCILNEIEWFLEGHYTKCRFLTLLIANGLYKEEYYKLSEELENKELLIELYKLAKYES
jgi:hypothetical protein